MNSTAQTREAAVRAVETASVRSTTGDAEASPQLVPPGAAMLAASPANRAAQLFAWAQRTRATSQRLRYEANELKETALGIRDSGRRPSG